MRSPGGARVSWAAARAARVGWYYEPTVLVDVPPERASSARRPSARS